VGGSVTKEIQIEFSSRTFLLADSKEKDTQLWSREKECQTQFALVKNLSKNKAVPVCIVNRTIYFSASFRMSRTGEKLICKDGVLLLEPGAIVYVKVSLRYKNLMRSRELIRDTKCVEEHLLICHKAWGRFHEHKRVILRFSAGVTGTFRALAAEQFGLEERITAFLSRLAMFWYNINSLAKKSSKELIDSSSYSVADIEELEQGALEDLINKMFLFLNEHTYLGNESFDNIEGDSAVINMAKIYWNLWFELNTLVDELLFYLSKLQHGRFIYHLCTLLFGVLLREETFAKYMGRKKLPVVIIELLSQRLGYLEYLLSCVPHGEPSLEPLRILKYHIRRKLRKQQ